ncbi:MAG: flavodoxin family protein [Deltaproteobacteria bacterium]|nr:flavodoxin family protein [Deltaproteobacteria bacterium]
MKIVAIVGSPRAKGNTSILVDAALEEAAAQGCEVEKIMLSEFKIEGCRGHDRCSTYDKCKIGDDIPMILDKFSNADGTILATPVYYYNMTAQMKTFVDRNFFLYTHGIPLKSKCMGLIVVAGGGADDITIKALKRCFRIQGGNTPENWLEVSGYAMGLGEVKNNPDLIAKARDLGKKMAERIGK